MGIQNQAKGHPAFQDCSSEGVRETQKPISVAGVGVKIWGLKEGASQLYQGIGRILVGVGGAHCGGSVSRGQAARGRLMCPAQLRTERGSWDLIP